MPRFAGAVPHVQRARPGPSAWLSQVDVVLTLAAATLVAIGAVSVYAATHDPLVAAGRPGNQYLLRVFVNAAVAVVPAAVVARSDYRQWPVGVPAVYGGLCLLLVLVLTPLGASVNGAHGWFALGPAQLEPSEFMKLGLILTLAALLGDRRNRERQPSRRDLVPCLLLTGIPAVLVLAEPALGIALVLAVIGLTIIALGGAPTRWVVVLILGGVLVGTAAFGLHLLKPYQEQRFTYLNDPQANTQTGYQIRQSEIAIGNGGLTGQGFLQGSQTDGGFIPEQQTDFIFTVSAEEGGLLAGMVLLGALGLVLLRGIAIAVAAPDLLGQLLAGGVTSWFAFQSFVNIGMTLGIMPVTGLPLPFVSYGGSSLLADTLGIAVLTSVYRASRRTSLAG